MLWCLNAWIFYLLIFLFDFVWTCIDMVCTYGVLVVALMGCWCTICGASIVHHHCAPKCGMSGRWCPMVGKRGLLLGTDGPHLHHPPTCGLWGVGAQWWASLADSAPPMVHWLGTDGAHHCAPICSWWDFGVQWWVGMVCQCPTNGVIPAHHRLLVNFQNDNFLCYLIGRKLREK